MTVEPSLDLLAPGPWTSQPPELWDMKSVVEPLRLPYFVTTVWAKIHTTSPRKLLPLWCWSLCCIRWNRVPSEQTEVVLFRKQFPCYRKTSPEGGHSRQAALETPCSAELITAFVPHSSFSSLWFHLCIRYPPAGGGSHWPIALQPATTLVRLREWSESLAKRIEMENACALSITLFRYLRTDDQKSFLPQMTLKAFTSAKESLWWCTRYFGLENTRANGEWGASRGQWLLSHLPQPSCHCLSDTGRKQVSGGDSRSGLTEQTKLSCLNML